MQSETEENIKRRNVLSSFPREIFITRKIQGKFFHSIKKKKKIIGNQILNVRNFKEYIGIYIIYILEKNLIQFSNYNQKQHQDR